MQIPKLLLILSATFVMASGAPTDDMENLRVSCENAANVLNTSLNNTMGMNTSSLVQNITWEVGASTVNLGSSNSSTAYSNTTTSFDPAYFDYIDSVLTLSQAIGRRGRIFHQEMNLPVYNALKGLATAVQAYGLQLRNAGLISQNASIRTFTAGSSIVDAESVWAHDANYPGPRRRSRRFASVRN